MPPAFKDFAHRWHLILAIVLALIVVAIPQCVEGAEGYAAIEVAEPLLPDEPGGLPVPVPGTTRRLVCG